MRACVCSVCDIQLTGLPVELLHKAAVFLQCLVWGGREGGWSVLSVWCQRESC